MELSEKEMRLLLNIVGDSLEPEIKEDEKGFETYCDKKYLFSKLVKIVNDKYPVMDNSDDGEWIFGTK